MQIHAKARSWSLAGFGSLSYPLFEAHSTSRESLTLDHRVWETSLRTSHTGWSGDLQNEAQRGRVLSFVGRE